MFFLFIVLVAVAFCFFYLVQGVAIIVYVIFLSLKKILIKKQNKIASITDDKPISQSNTTLINEKYIELTNQLIQINTNIHYSSSVQEKLEQQIDDLDKKIDLLDQEIDLLDYKIERLLDKNQL